MNKKAAYMTTWSLTGKLMFWASLLVIFYCIGAFAMIGEIPNPLLSDDGVIINILGFLLSAAVGFVFVLLFGGIAIAIIGSICMFIGTTISKTYKKYDKELK